MKIRLVSWNIAGGKRYSSGVVDLEYIRRQLDILDPEVVCFQESHSNKDWSLAEEVLGSTHDYIVDFPISESHNDADYELTLSIGSKLGFQSPHLIGLPNPSLVKHCRDGSKIFSHDKGVVCVELEGLFIANTQFLPLHVFDTSYEDWTGLCRSIEVALLGGVYSPSIFCGDFNHVFPEKLYPVLFDDLLLRDVLPGVPTFVYRKENPDHIYVTDGVQCADAGIVKTDTDHFLCWCDLEI